MSRPSFLLLIAVGVLAGSWNGAAQQYQPKSIQFFGAPQYTGQELLAAAELKPGISLTVDEMKQHAKLLMDSGVFDSITFQFTGVDLRYILTPSTALLPIRLTNLPLAEGAELDAKLHERMPLYHGNVPADGGLTDQVRAALEELLAAQGIKATVEAVATSEAVSRKSAVFFSITAPPVLVGAIHLDGKSPTLEPKAEQILEGMTGAPYDQEGSPSQIATYLGNYYRDEGYIEAAVAALPQSPAVVSADSIRIPFQVSVAPGILYKIASVRLAPELLVTQADFDRQANIEAGDIADGQRVSQNWEFIARQYHNRGYMQAKIHPAPSFDREKGTVSYDVTAETGPVYTMGGLTIENVGDDLRATMLAAWKMPAGTVFNEGAILNFYAIGGANIALSRVFATADCKYVLHLNDTARTVDVVLRLEKKH
jgi:outer membrane protein insertion porin family